MANKENNPGHTKFFCATSPRDGQPFVMRFDPAIFSDEAIGTMLRSQINYVLGGNGFVTITLSDLKEKAKEIKITPLSLLERDRKENLIEELFLEVRRADIIKGVIRRDEAVAKKFIETDMKDSNRMLSIERKLAIEETTFRRPSNDLVEQILNALAKLPNRMIFAEWQNKEGKTAVTATINPNITRTVQETRYLSNALGKVDRLTVRKILPL